MDLKHTFKFISIFIAGLGISFVFRRLKKSIQLDNSNIFKITNDEKEIMREQLKRNYEFFGDEGMSKIIDSFVIVVGIGGVGSHVVMTLIRSGIRKIRVIDYDIVTLSSLNRHAFAMRSDVGKLKVRVMQEYAKRINPNIEMEIIDDAFLDKYADKYLSGNPDYVVDCIDDIKSKCDLLKYCSDAKLKVISSMGAGGRLDPTSVRIANFNFIKGENLARQMRTRFKEKFKLPVPDIKCIYSMEKPFRGLSELEPHQLDNPEEYRVNFNERVRSIPVFASLPAIFGQALASTVLTELAGIKLDNLNKLEDVEETIGNINISKLYEDFKKIYIDCNLVFDDFLTISKAFGYVSSITQKTGPKMRFEIFNKEKGIVVNNIIILSRSEQNKHQILKNEFELKNYYGEEIYNRIYSILNNFK
jgi:tRNA A37 threonylcarbamoyladenosine dehydratase